MWTIACVVGPASFALLFKTEEAAKTAQKICEIGINTHTNVIIHIADDFGQTLTVKRDDLKGYMCEDLEQSKLARVEFALHQNRTQILAQKAAESDVVIRNARFATGRGAAVLDPIGMPFNGGRQ